jgi:exodeoxyribonuclease VII large subunit
MVVKPHVSTQASLLREIYTVSRLNRTVKHVLETGFPSVVWVEGEISNLSQPASGHSYFSLKDDQSQVRCAFFRAQQRGLTVVLQDGLHVIVKARVGLYEGRGEFQLIIEYLEEAGEGVLQRALEALKRRLHQEGLFDVRHKRRLPRLPRRIGLLTSSSGAVVHDIITTLRRRFPAIPVLLYPVPVQGEGAAERIAAAITAANTRKECDALILARGGGSLEDLWAFNEEVVARAIFECQIPLVCGVGHETDVTIADLVADVRAPTPTAAAELLSPSAEEWLGYFCYHETRLVRLVHDRMRSHQQQLDWLTGRLVHPKQRILRLFDYVFNLERRLRLLTRTALHARSATLAALASRIHQRSPRSQIQNLSLRCQHLGERITVTMQHDLAQRRQRLQALAQGLRSLSPLATLERGYAIVQRRDTGAVICDAGDVTPGERVDARLARGQLRCVVEESRKVKGQK